MNLLTGKFSKVALQHDASRVVQAAIQFGNKKQRKVIVEEICVGDGGDAAGGGRKGNSNNSFIELAKSQYAHFVVLKMIKHCYKDNESIALIVKVGNCKLVVKWFID